MSNHSSTQPNLIPRHVAIIMDGNNRYGKTHALPSGAGHLAGKNALDPIVEYCADIGVQVLTVFAFSSENWARPKAEVDLLMTLLKNTIHEQMPRMNKYRIRLRFIGERCQLSEELQALMKDAEERTAHFDKMTLVIAVSYGGKDDIARACRTIAHQIAQGKLSADMITADTVAQYVELSDVPPVDMLVRTGGDYRISNFLLWQTAYAELFFTSTLWPDFTPDELSKMIVEFGNRERRFGKTSEQIAKKDTGL